MAFSLDLVAKDLDLILALAAEVDAPMPQAKRNREKIRDAIRAGLGQRDLSTLAEFHRRGR